MCGRIARGSARGLQNSSRRARGQGPGSGCAAVRGTSESRTSEKRGDLMWAFLGKAFRQRDLVSRGMEGWAWAEPVAAGGGMLERVLGPGYEGLWLILEPEG